MPRRVLITGASGFVGVNLCRRMLAAGHEVHALVRPGTDAWRLHGIRDHLSVHEATLADPAAVATALEDARPDWIFHTAAHGAYSWQTDLRTILQVNAVGTAQLLEAAAGRGFSAFVNLGSSSEYGYKDHAPHEFEWIDPNSAYAVGKAAATLFGRMMARERDLHVVTLRLYSVYGPWEEPNRLLPALAVHGLAGRLPPLVDPRTARDFVHVDDVCRACELAAELTTLERGGVLNVGGGRQVTLAELVELTRRTFGISQPPEWGSMPARGWDTSTWVADTGRIRRELGWQPQVGLEQGLADFAAWLRSDPGTLELYRSRIGVNS